MWSNSSDVFCTQRYLRAVLEWEEEGRSSPEDHELFWVGKQRPGPKSSIKHVGYLWSITVFPALAVLSPLFYNPAKIRSHTPFWVGLGLNWILFSSWNDDFSKKHWNQWEVVLFFSLLYFLTYILRGIVFRYHLHSFKDLAKVYNPKYPSWQNSLGFSGAQIF